jgi:DNA-binding NtrC family response regulator
VLESILEEEYVVDTAQNGTDAIKKTRTGLYNLALIDIRLPDMEGTELLTRMKETIPKMRKIIMTGYPSLGNAIAAVNKGADAYLMKPFDIEKVLKVIKEQLVKWQQEKRYSQERVTDFIETRVMEIEAQRGINGP